MIADDWKIEGQKRMPNRRIPVKIFSFSTLRCIKVVVDGLFERARAHGRCTEFRPAQATLHCVRGGRVGSQTARESLAAGLCSLSGAGFTPATLAITLKILAEDAAARQRAIDQIQLVWTSPDEEGPHVRDTSVVVRQLSSEALRSLWISTYSIFNGQDVFLPIHEALSQRPVLHVVLILNIPVTTRTHSLARRQLRNTRHSSGSIMAVGLEASGLL